MLLGYSKALSYNLNFPSSATKMRCYISTWIFWMLDQGEQKGKSVQLYHLCEIQKQQILFLVLFWLNRDDFTAEWQGIANFGAFSLGYSNCDAIAVTVIVTVLKL